MRNDALVQGGTASPLKNRRKPYATAPTAAAKPTSFSARKTATIFRNSRTMTESSLSR